MKTTSKSRIALAIGLAFMLTVAAAGGATATISSVDTSTTDSTSSESQLQAGTVVEMNNTSQSHIYQVIATNLTESPVTKVWDNGTIIDKNSSMVNITSATDAASEGSHWNATIDESSLVDAEHSAGEQVDVELRAFNNSSASDFDVNTTIKLNFTDATSVQNVDDADVDAGDFNGDGAVTVTDDSFEILGTNLTIGPLGTTIADVETDDRSVNGSNTTVYLVFSNESTKDMFDDAADDASSEDSLSALWAGERTAVLVSSTAETTAAPVYYKEAPDDVESSETYAVYKKHGGTWALEVNLGDEFEDSDTVRIHTVGSAGRGTFLGSYVAESASGLTSMFGFSTPGAGLSSVLALVPLAAAPGRRRDVEDVLVVDEGDDESDDEGRTEPESTVSPSSPGDDTETTAEVEA